MKKTLLAGGCLALALFTAPAWSIGVRALPLGELLTPLTHSAPATVVSLNESRIAAELTARISTLSVKVGQVVEAGAELARLNCRTYQHRFGQATALLAELNARHELARQQLKRSQSLASGKGISAHQLSQHRTELAVLEAKLNGQNTALAQAKDQLDACVVVSPFRGVVLERLGQVGELVTPGSGLIRLLDLESVELSAQVLSSAGAGLNQGRQLVFHHQGRDYPVRLRALTPVVDPATDSREARLVFDRLPADRQPSIGSRGRLHWRDPQDTLPAELLVQRAGDLGVFSVQAGQAVFIALPGALEGRSVAIDLPLSTPIVTEGRQALRDGDPVTVVQ